MNSIIAFLRRRRKTEARRSCGSLRMRARDERTVCEVERVRSREGRGRTGNPWNAVKPCVGHGGPARQLSPQCRDNQMLFRRLFR